MVGRVIKNYNGYYYVDVGPAGLWECRRRGKVKTKILVGDMLVITPIDTSKGVIEQVLARKNELRRPAVANVDQIMVVMTPAVPKLNYRLTDTLLASCMYQHLTPILLLNKCELNPHMTQWYTIYYRQCGYEVYAVSAYTGAGIGAVTARLDGKMTVFSGPSGVGKSSLLARITGREDLHIGAVSKKIQRGRHTTRHAEIIPLREQTYVVDTPGFSAVALASAAPEEIQNLFPEFASYSGSCRFSPCAHMAEPDCRIKEAVKDGHIFRPRYESYCQLFQEAKERKK